MAGIVDKISTIKQFLNILTWKKILQVSVFLFIAGISWAIFENRRDIYAYLFDQHWASAPSKSIKISAESKSSIDYIVNKSNLIAGIQITLVNFDKNSRVVVYTYSDNENLKKLYVDFLERSIGDLPLFNEDSLNNMRISQLINGEFVCNPIEDTIIHKLVPDSSKSVTTVCAIGIPPIYGKFTGIFTIYLGRPPSKEEIDQLRLASRTLSKEIFERDFR